VGEDVRGVWVFISWHFFVA